MEEADEAADEAADEEEEEEDEEAAGEETGEDAVPPPRAVSSSRILSVKLQSPMRRSRR